MFCACENNVNVLDTQTGKVRVTDLHQPHIEERPAYAPSLRAVSWAVHMSDAQLCQLHWPEHC